MSEEQQGEQKEASEICWSGLTDVGRFRKNNDDFQTKPLISEAKSMMFSPNLKLTLI